jgi:DNA-binding MurR/RpiR family transcriptional regulator
MSQVVMRSGFTLRPASLRAGKAAGLGVAADELMARIRRHSPKLSRGQRKVVDLFVGRSEQAVFLTSLSVARAVGVSEATVVRTARALGFGGYPQFREAFRTNFLQRMSTVARVRLSARARHKETDIAAAVLETEFSNLEATRQRLDPKALARAVDLIIGARAVYVVGMRSAYSLAWLLHFSLMLIRARSHLLTLGVGDAPERLEGIDTRDVVVGISFERYASATVTLFRACLEQGARGIALTDKPTSPLADGADVVLEAQNRLSSFIDSYVAPTAVIDVLVTLVAAKRRRTVLRALADREETWRRHRTYL